MVFSLLVAAFWGGNIGALYPVIQVAFKGRSLQAWIEEEIQESQRAVDRHRASVRQLQAQLARHDAESTLELRRKLSEAQFNLEAEQRVLETSYIPVPSLFDTSCFDCRFAELPALLEEPPARIVPVIRWAYARVEWQATHPDLAPFAGAGGITGHKNRLKEALDIVYLKPMKDASKI